MLSRAKSAIGEKPVQNQPSFFKRFKWPLIVLTAMILVALAFDGSFLWIGEFKFSERLLRFSIKP